MNHSDIKNNNLKKHKNATKLIRLHDFKCNNNETATYFKLFTDEEVFGDGADLNLLAYNVIESVSYIDFNT